MHEGVDLFAPRGTPIYSPVGGRADQYPNQEGGNAVMLYPIFHPAAALYTPRMLQVLEEDFSRIPELLGRPVAPPAPPAPLYVPEPPVEHPVQLGLF